MQCEVCGYEVDPIVEALDGDIVSACIMRRVAERFPGSATWHAVEVLEGREEAPEGALSILRNRHRSCVMG